MQDHLAAIPATPSAVSLQSSATRCRRLQRFAAIRERLAREGRIHGPVMESQRLVSKGYTNAEKALAGNYAVGDVVAFHRPYKRIGVEKGDERRVTGVNHKTREVVLEGRDGGKIAWKPREIGGRRGGSEVYRTEGIEPRAGDRIRWTRNDAGLGLVNSRTAEVLSVANGRVGDHLEARIFDHHPRFGVVGGWWP